MNRVTVLHADSRDAVRTLPANSIDSLVSDAPYSLVSIVQRFGADGAAPATSQGASGVYQRASAGFMGQAWDTGETAHDVAFWREIYRVMKPGAFIVVAAGTRTYHRLACAIEDAGFEIRDMISWLYGSGFPKSHNHDIGGVKHGTALKPACEPWVLARKPLCGGVAANIVAHGVGVLNIDGCRVPIDAMADAGQVRTMTRGRRDAPDGWGMSVGGAAVAQVLSCTGRWPANVVHDGSFEVVEAFPVAGGQRGDLKAMASPRPTKTAFGDMEPAVAHVARGDSGSAARFFYCAKAKPSERVVSCTVCGARAFAKVRCDCVDPADPSKKAGTQSHPTVKPVALMRWLCRLVTPAGGVVLDPFAGSGTTGAAAMREGFGAILIEREARFVADIHARLDAEQGNARRAA
ncbi:MAG: Site-specific DNA-methyltransferase [Caulobacter sp.]|nr:Site-specific DNA-methyltransferase [Caulobacter sp.]